MHSGEIQVNVLVVKDSGRHGMIFTGQAEKLVLLHKFGYSRGNRVS